MLAYVLRRLAATVAVMAVVAFVVFGLLYLTPGDPAAILAGDAATSDDIRRIREKLGLDQPFHIRFGAWLWALAHGDLGTSIFTNLPVTQLIGQRIEPTLALTGCTLLVAVLIAVTLGVLAAARAGSWLDRAVMTFSVLGFSVPVFVLAYILILVFSIELDWLPVQGYANLRDGFWEWLRHLVLPSIALGTVYMALIARMTRASMLEVLAQDYIRTAQAKGLDQASVLGRHALKNAAIPIVTIVGDRRRAPHQRRRGHRDGVRDPGRRAADRGRDPAPRLPDHPGRDAALFRGVRVREPCGRPVATCTSTPASATEC